MAVASLVQVSFGSANKFKLKEDIGRFSQDGSCNFFSV